MNAQGFAWRPRDLKEVEANYVDERSSRWMYLALADLDRDPRRAAMLRELAKYEEKHADRWERLLRVLHRRIPARERMWTHRVLVGLARLLGVGAVLPLLHKGEVDGIAKYRDQMDRWKDPRAQEILREILPDEVVHEVDAFRAAREVRGSQGGLRSAILGANDGLGSILALASGVAGATNSSATVLIAASAGLVAGAVSMAASNYVSVKAEQDVYASQVQLSRHALQVAPDVKEAELVEAYRSKGLTEAEARTVVARLAEMPEEFMKAVLAEEHGLAEESFESPPRLAAYTGVAFLLAGAIPILPFLFLPALPGVFASVGVTAVALFAAGVLRALSTLNPFLKSGLEMVLVGMGSATVTYLVGLAVGVAVG